MATAPRDDDASPKATHRWAGRVDDVRSRAEQAAERYQELARRKPVYALPIVALTTYVARQGMLLASAIAFRTFLWMLPLALLVSGVVAGLSGPFPSVSAWAAGATGAAATARQQVVVALDEAAQSWWVAMLVGLVGFLWTTRTLMRNLSQATAHVWDAPRRRRTQKEIAVSSLIFAGCWLGVFVVAAVSTSPSVPPSGFVAGLVGQMVLTGIAWLVISLRLPDRRRSWVDLLPGSALFGFGLATLHLVGRVYLPPRFEHSSQLYGSLGVAAVILVWLLLIGHLTIVSALVNRVWLDYRVDRESQELAAASYAGRPTRAS